MFILCSNSHHSWRRGGTWIWVVISSAFSWSPTTWRRVIPTAKPLPISFEVPHSTTFSVIQGARPGCFDRPFLDFSDDCQHFPSLWRAHIYIVIIRLDQDPVVCTGINKCFKPRMPLVNDHGEREKDVSVFGLADRWAPGIKIMIDITSIDFHVSGLKPQLCMSILMR